MPHPTFGENVDEVLLSDGRKVLLVGTAHVSASSVALVEQVIEAEKPNSVAVELCAPRLQSLRDPDRWKNMDVVSAVRQGRGPVLLLQLLLSGFQRKISKKLGVQPGAEMMRAVELCEKQGASLVLADREVRITLKRVWNALSFWSLFKLSVSLVNSLIHDEKDISEAEIERLKSGDALNEALAEFAKQFPAIKSPLIDERDIYLAEKIRRSPGETIVAVVGAGHVPGITSHIHAPTDLKELESIPPPSSLKKIFAWSIPTLVVVLIVYGFFAIGSKASGEMISMWIWVNGFAAALGAALALGHPLSVLAAFISAPITSLHPFLASGWIAGLVEAMIKKPRVSDLQTLAEDVTTVRGWWRNRVSKILLVMALTNLFGTAGMFLGTWLVATTAFGG